MRTRLDQLFHLKKNRTSVKQEIIAGMTTYFTCAYILAVNAMILSDAGIPLEAGVIATALSSFVGCLLMAFWANSPIVLIPGMGVNAFFVYTIVQSMGLSWQSALGAVFVSGIIFVLFAFTPITTSLAKAIPQSLKDAITVGIGLFLTFIGLQKGGIIIKSETTYVAMGNLGSLHVEITLICLMIALILFVRNVKGSFLISMLAGTILAILTGEVKWTDWKASEFSFGSFSDLWGAISLSDMVTLPFWIACFSLLMIILFENMSLIQGLIPDQLKFKRSYQTTAISTMLSGVFGTSPTVASVESAAGIAAGGRTGLTSITSGVLFLLSLLFLPFVKLIPDSAVAPILIIIGALMIQHIQSIPLQDFSEGFPAFLIIVLIPLTASIADGIAFGFIAYPVMKLALGKAREIPALMFVLSGLFLLNFLLHVTA